LIQTNTEKLNHLGPTVMNTSVHRASAKVSV